MTKCDALLALLSDGKAHPMDELRNVAGWRYGARLWELTKRGHKFDAVCVKHPNVYTYRLIVEPKQLSFA
jgi:hypothetical protein